MGGANRAADIASLHGLDRKSLKWWKKVLYQIVSFATVNAWLYISECVMIAERNRS